MVSLLLNNPQLLFGTQSVWFRIAEFLLEYPSSPGTGKLPVIGDILSSSSHSPNAGPTTSSFNTDVTMSIGEPGPSHSNTSTQSATSPALASLGLRDEEPMDDETADLFMIARSLYDAKELERVAYILRYVKHPKARFLGLYSKYIVRPYSLPAPSVKSTYRWMCASTSPATRRRMMYGCLEKVLLLLLLSITCS